MKHYSTSTTEANIRPDGAPVSRLSIFGDLVSYILEREKAFQPLTKKEIHDFAEALSSVSGTVPYIGKNWVNRFLLRNPNIEMKPSRVIGAARKRCTGVQLGETDGGIVAGTVITSSSERIQSESSTWSSILEAVSADGRRLMPCVVFTGQNLQGQWFPEAFPNWKYTTSPTGWSNADIFIEWFMKVFLPETKPEDPSQWRLLVLDQHKSHITAELMKKAWLHKVWLSWLPSHSSHITQLLDVAVFGPLKVYYRQRTRNWASYDATSPHQQQLFLQAYEWASKKALIRRNNLSGFSASGIHPISVKKAIEALKPVERKRKSFEGPITPRKRPVTSDMIWSTPQGSQDIQKQLIEAQKQGNALIRDFNCILKKAMKSIDQKNSQMQRLEEKKALLKATIAAREPTGKVTVQFDPNQAFPEAHQIITAQDEAEANVLHRINENRKKPRKRKSPKTPSADQQFLKSFLKP
ncbi:related to transposase [Fusarium oxysporum]|uniref:Related to transposase n=1 Tax=Fusarium oxysporum TaxID=5507 RepID=A0A2H3U498_FUSOX|nr:related to transposase [Fusarium oxysporum]